MAGKKKPHRGDKVRTEPRKEAASESKGDSNLPADDFAEFERERGSLEERLRNINPILQSTFLQGGRQSTHELSRSRSVSPLAENRALMPLVPANQNEIEQVDENGQDEEDQDGGGKRQDANVGQQNV